MQLSFVGIAGTNYALDWSASLSPPNWLPQATNPATNNFWRIRSVP